MASKDRIAQQAHHFRTLVSRLRPESLKLGWHRLNKQAASGVDKITAQDYAGHLSGNLQGLSERLRSKRYKAKLVKRKYIPAFMDMS